MLFVGSSLDMEVIFAEGFFNLPTFLQNKEIYYLPKTLFSWLVANSKKSSQWREIAYSACI